MAAWIESLRALQLTPFVFVVLVCMTLLGLVMGYAGERFWWARGRKVFEVALKRGESPLNPEKYAPYAVAINLVAGGVAAVLIVTHAAAQAAMADRVIHFADGNVREVVVNKKKLTPEEIEW